MTTPPTEQVDPTPGGASGPVPSTTPRTMAAAAEWLRRDASHHDRFLLVVDEFDPHEPFDVPEPWASRYDPHWDGARRAVRADRCRIRNVRWHER